MRSKSYAFLFFLLFLTVCPGSMVLAGEQKTIFATIRSCVYWIHQTDSNTVRSSRQLNPNRGPVHGLEKKGVGLRKEENQETLAYLKECSRKSFLKEKSAEEWK